MKATGLDVSKILIYDERRSRSTVSVFLSSPTPLEEANLGRLFILSEIEATDRESENIMNIVEEEISASYYGSSDFEIETAFENALTKANQRLHQLIREGHTTWLDTFSTVVAVIKGGAIHFSQLGRIHAFLIHSKQIIDLLENTSRTEREKINPLKIFSNVVSGVVREHDAVLFCSSSLLDYLSLEKLRKTIYEHSAQEAAQYLQALLIENTINATFGGIILKLRPLEDLVVKSEAARAVGSGGNGAHVTAPDKSMSSLIHKERKTSELLEPSIISHVKKRVRQFVVFVQERSGRGKTSPPPLPPSPVLAEPHEAMEEQLNAFEKEDQPMLRQRSGGRGLSLAIVRDSLRSVLRGAAKLLTAMLDLLRKVFLKQPKQARTRNIRAIPRRTSRGAASLLLRFLNMPRKRKIILLAAVAFLVIFSWTIVSQGERKEQEQQRETYSTQLARAETKLGEAKAATVIENNEEKVRLLLIEAKGLLQSIPESEKDLQQKRSDLLKNIESELTQVNHVTTVEPTIVGDIAGTFPEAGATAFGRLGENPYALDAASNTLYTTNAEGVATKIEGHTESDGKLLAMAMGSSSVVFLTSTKTVLELTPPSAFAKRDIVFSDAAGTAISDAAIFNDNLYILDSEHSTILKHTKTGANFSEGMPWITDGTSVSSATSLSVDGAIYLGTSNGDVLKLFQGKKDSSFSLDAIDPKLNRVDDTIADDRVSNIYLLDREGKRIVVFTKDGNFVRQYTSDRFNRLVGFAVDEAKKTITVLNNTTVMTFATE